MILSVGAGGIGAVQCVLFPFSSFPTDTFLPTDRSWVVVVNNSPHRQCVVCEFFPRFGYPVGVSLFR